VLLNVLLGFAQEYRANRALEELRAYVVSTARVLREGKEWLVPASDLVVGDIVMLGAGTRIPADVRLLETDGGETMEAPLTGESVSISKQVDAVGEGAVIGERSCMAFTGTVVVAGRMVGVVVATGKNTELGKITSLVEEAGETVTPLQRQLKRLAWWISLAAIGMATAVFGLSLGSGRDALTMFQTSVALAVAAIPEGLGIFVTVILAVGMRRILARQGLVRKLISAETLGSVSVVCTDKTGTMTEGVMRVARVRPAGMEGMMDAIEKGDAPVATMRVLELVMLCNDATLVEDAATKQQTVLGSPTERALMEAGMSAGLEVEALRKKHPRFCTLPFTSDRKFMATCHEDHEAFVIVKGAPERVLGRCVQEGVVGVPRALSDRQRKMYAKEAALMAGEGLRVLAVAWKRHAKREPREEELNDLVFVGFVALRDPLRADAAGQVANIRAAGVRTVMVTGDHPDTARTIAREAGIAKEPRVVTGMELDGLDDEILKKQVKDVDVFARVEPRHKIRIIRAWQARGLSVAMTGDGVNDAPALAAADIGVALGSGTDVAKESADLVLLDDRLATISAAVVEGRAIFDNIRKSVAYVLASSLTEVVLVAGAIALGLPLPLLPAHILWINLVADGLPNTALAFEPSEPGQASSRPRPRHEPVVDRHMLWTVGFTGLFSDAVLLAVFVWLIWSGTPTVQAHSILFAAVGFGSVLVAYSVRGRLTAAWRIDPRTNLPLLAGVLIGWVLMMCAFAVMPVREALGLSLLTLPEWLLSLMMAGMKFVSLEAAKAFARQRSLYATT
jgi:Ca2+-transporting ATPase